MTKKEKAAKERAKLRAEGSALRKCRARILQLARYWHTEAYPSEFTRRFRAASRTEPFDWLSKLARAIEEEKVLKQAASATTPLHITIDHERCACGTAAPGEPYVSMTAQQLAVFDWPKEKLALIGLHRCESCAVARIEYEQRGTS